MRLHVADRARISTCSAMNFLSSLDRWGVEGRWLVLRESPLTLCRPLRLHNAYYQTLRISDERRPSCRLSGWWRSCGACAIP